MFQQEHRFADSYAPLPHLNADVVDFLLNAMTCEVPIHQVGRFPVHLAGIPPMRMHSMEVMDENVENM